MTNGFNHVGVGVADIDTAIGFYRSVFGCRVLRGKFEVRSDGPDGEEAVDVLSSRPFRRMFLAHMATGDGVGIELFQLVDPPHEPRDPPLEYWKSGVFHICFTAPDLDATLQKLLAAGGKQISQSWGRDTNNPEKRMVYCTDPWGTIIELYTQPFTEMYD